MKAWSETRQALKAAQDNPKECVEHASQAIAHLAGEYGDPPRQPPNDAPMLGSEMGPSYQIRARCKKRLGDAAGALSDIAKAKASDDEFCRRARAAGLARIQVDNQCRNAADDAELLAQWQKEAAK
jgi:hypothetical protein